MIDPQPPFTTCPGEFTYPVHYHIHCELGLRSPEELEQLWKAYFTHKAIAIMLSLQK
jgi:hypothetical protein